MRNVLLSSTLLVALVLAGCYGATQPTDQAPSVIQTIDRILAVRKAADGTVTSTGSPFETGIPIVTVGLGVAALAWRMIRGLSDSVPADTHNALISAQETKDAAHAQTVQTLTSALGNSQPVVVDGSIPVKAVGG
jgi:hypothetical protein